MVKNLRVAFFIGLFPKISESWFIEQVTSLIDAGVDVRIFAFRHGDQQDVSDVVRQYKLLERTTYLSPPTSRLLRWVLAVVFAIKILLSHPSAMRKLIKPDEEHAGSLQYIFWVAPIIGKIESCDIVHCHFGMVANKYLIIREILGLQHPLVTTFYGQDSSKYIQQKGGHVYDKLKRHSVRLFTMTTEMTERMIGFGFLMTRVRELYTGLRMKDLRFSERTFAAGDKFKIVFVGRFVEKKGVPDLLRAIARVINRHQNIEVHIFGGGDIATLNEEIKRLVIEEKLDDFVIFHGMTPNDQVRRALYNMHLAVQLSKTAADGDTDDLPVALLEAQATGLPVVTTRHVGIPDGVKEGETGFLVDEGDYCAAAEKICHFVEHPEIIPQMSRSARKFMEERFDIENINKGLIGTYQEIIYGS